MSDRVRFGDDATAEMTGVNAGMAKRCYYDVLGVERTADESELKSAFRKLAMKWHPDRNPGDKSCEVRFKEINEAYEILKDPDKRAAYNRFGHAAFEHAGPGAAGGFGDVASAFADIFDDLFGMGGGRRGRAGGRERGADLRYNMEITLEEAYSGKSAQVRIRHAQGFFTLERTCPACQGRGQVIDNPCPACSGSGRVTRERTLSVSIPAGVEDGTRIRLAGEGEAGVRSGPAGDLYIFLALSAHPFFQREGADLFCRVPISMVLAALGGDIEVPTIDGSHSRVKVPEGTQSGRRFRLQGKGMPVLRSKQFGDMYIQVLVETPQKLSKRQRELLTEFERLSSKETQPETAGFFGKVREFLGRSGAV